MAKNIKLSGTMDEALYYLGWGIYRAHLEPSARTLEALERRGMIRWSTEAELGAVGERRVHDTTRLWTITLEGWAFLKAEHDMDRPADEGRRTVDEALADTTWVGDIAISETEYAACLKSWAQHGTVPGLENDMAFVARVRKDLDRVDVMREDGGTDITYRVVAATDRRLPVADALEAADLMRYDTIRPGLPLNWPTPAETGLTEAEVTEAERRDLFDTVKHANRPETKREDWETYLSPEEQRSVRPPNPDEVADPRMAAERAVYAILGEHPASAQQNVRVWRCVNAALDIVMGETRAQWKERNFHHRYGSPMSGQDVTRDTVAVVDADQLQDRLDGLWSAAPVPVSLPRLADRADQLPDRLRRDLADRLGEPRGRSWSHLLDRVDQLKATALEHAPIPYRLAAEEAGSGAGGGPQDGDDLYADPDRWRTAPVTYKCPVCRHDFAVEETRDTHVGRHHG